MVRDSRSPPNVEGGRRQYRRQTVSKGPESAPGNNVEAPKTRAQETAGEGSDIWDRQGPDQGSNRDPTPGIRLRRLLIDDSPRLASSVGQDARPAPEPCGPAATRPLPPEHKAQESLSPSSLEARGPEVSSVPPESQKCQRRWSCSEGELRAIPAPPRPLPESPLHAPSPSPQVPAPSKLQ